MIGRGYGDGNDQKKAAEGQQPIYLRRIVKQALRLALLVKLVVLALSAKIEYADI